MKNHQPSKITKLAMIIARLQTTLDVYDGLFNKEEDAQKIGVPFPEIYQSISQSMRTHIITTCAAIFSDPSKDKKRNENLSLKNLEEIHKKDFSEETKKLIQDIFEIVEKMNLKEYRNKHIGHFSLEEIMGAKSVSESININNVRDLLDKTQQLLNKIAHDAGHMPKTACNDFYTKIPSRQSTDEFLNRLSKSNDS